MGRNSCRSMDSERHRHKQQSHCRSSNKQALPLVAGNTGSPLQQHDSSVNAIRHCRSHLVSRRIKQRQSVIIQFAHGKMIASWRKGFGKNFPFYMVQIAPYNYHSTNNGPALIREAQEQVAHRVDNVGLITTTDIGDPDNIHPTQKAEAGFRLANLVLGRTYKALKKGYETPFFTQMTIEKGKAILSFSHTEKKLVCPDKKSEE